MEYVLQRRGNECVDCISLNNPEKSLIDVFPILTWIQKLFWEKVTCSSFRWDNITSILVSTWYKYENKECLIIIQQVYHMHQKSLSHTLGVKIFSDVLIFYHKWNGVWLLVIKIVFTSCTMSYRTVTYDLRKLKKIQ